MVQTPEPPLPRQHFDLDRIFCDGHGYLLTSRSLGGCTLAEFCNAHYRGTDRDRKALLRRGVYLPILFDGDCQLDGGRVLLGDLTEDEQAEWRNLLTWKLTIPCGELLVFCEGGDDEWLANAITDTDGSKADYYEFVRVPPGEYRIDLYASPGRFVLHLTPVTENIPMPTLDGGWIDLPNLGDVFDPDEFDLDDDE